MPVIYFFYAVILGLILAAGNADAGPVTIKFSHEKGENTPKGMGALLFKELAEKRLPGKVAVEVFPNSQLFSVDNELHGLLLGDVQMLAPSLANLYQFNPQIQVFELPFLFNDINALHRFQASDSGKSILGSLTKNGYTGLAYWDDGMKLFTATQPLRLPMDADGLTFAINASEIAAAEIRTVGGIPITIAQSEFYEALKTGQANGTETLWWNVYSAKLFELQPYVVETDHAYAGFMVITNSKFWSGLPSDVRQTLTSIIDDVTVEVNRLARERAGADRQKIIDSGFSQAIPLTPDDRAKWVDAMRPVVDRFGTAIGPELLDAARSANTR